MGAFLVAPDKNKRANQPAADGEAGGDGGGGGAEAAGGENAEGGEGSEGDKGGAAVPADPAAEMGLDADKVRRYTEAVERLNQLEDRAQAYSKALVEQAKDAQRKHKAALESKDGFTPAQAVSLGLKAESLFAKADAVYAEDDAGGGTAGDGDAAENGAD